MLKKLSFYINQDDRIALLGKNGNGKSTLVKLLSSHLPLLDGTMKKSGKLKIGYFNQNQTEELPLEQTPAEYLAALLPDKPEKSSALTSGVSVWNRKRPLPKLTRSPAAKRRACCLPAYRLTRRNC